MQSSGDKEYPRVRFRNPKDIIAEIESIGLEEGGHLFLTDLNTMTIPRNVLVEMFTYLKQKGIKWYTEGTVSGLLSDHRNGDDELLRLMSPLDGKGGCASFLYGADDLVNSRVKGSLDKDRELVSEAVEVFREYGIPFNLSVVVGLDNHEFPDSVFLIRKTLEEVRAAYTFLHVATPYTGTPWGDLVKKQGRVIDEDTIHYNHRRVVHTPAKMTSGQLQQGYYWLLSRLNSPKNVARTAGVNTNTQLFKADSLLGVIGSGLPWGIESFLTASELYCRGNFDKIVFKELDAGYEKWTEND